MKIDLTTGETGESFIEYAKAYALLNDRAESPANTREALDVLKTALLLEARRVMRSYVELGHDLQRVRRIRKERLYAETYLASPSKVREMIGGSAAPDGSRFDPPAKE